MKIDAVSPTFAFACRHGEYWEEFVLNEPEFADGEVTPEEREAIDAARDHVRDSGVALLQAVMAEVHRRAGKDNWLKCLTVTRRPSTLSDRFWLDLPLVEASSIEALVSFSLEPSTVDGDERPVRIFPAIWRQTRRGKDLDAVADSFSVKLNNYGQVAYIAAAGVTIEEGARLDELAILAVNTLWDLALAFRARLVPRPAPVTAEHLS